MSLKCEPALVPLHIYVKWLFGAGISHHLAVVGRGADHQRRRHGEDFFFFFITLEPRVE